MSDVTPYPDTQKQPRLTRWVIVAGALLLALLGSILLLSEPHPADLGGRDGKLGGAFTLTSADGPVSLSDFRGQTVVVYFGFTNCPKVCPASMGTIKRSFNRLSTAQQAKVQALLITVDPERDTPQVLAQFAQRYHPRIIGLTGSQAELDAVAADYGSFIEPTAGAAESDFRHSSRYYIINPNGELVDAMRHGTSANELTARLQQVLGQSAQGALS
ncbi:MAG: SCO family protein [Pseudomonadota bacterium]